MTTDSDDARREGYDVGSILADEDQVAACARANMAALVAELVERGCAEPWAGIEDGEADDEWPDCLQFSFECPPGYQGDIVMPGVPLGIVKGGEGQGEAGWEVVHNGVSYAWDELVDRLSAFDAARRTIWANRDRLVAELVRRGVPLRDEDVTSDPDASGDSWVTHHIVAEGAEGEERRRVRVSIPDVVVGPGLSHEMYVEGYPYAWEAAVEAAVVVLTGDHTP
ncbi:hypothetical protein AB0G35_04270 [Streptomyces sp. NPDC021749]|uniref:hypothetical protein n=1 Tax=Streptomyces sp. NPDC021749 TaxID=3154905 RepID=UPI0034019180